MDKLSEHAIRMLEIVNREGVANRDIDAIAQAVYDLILQVQMLKMVDRKTENSSEKPNNCTEPTGYNLTPVEDEPKTEPQSNLLLDAMAKAFGIETEPQTELVNDSPILVKDLVDDEFNPYDEECMRCKHLKLKCEFIPTYCKFESRDEPQTERSE